MMTNEKITVAIVTARRNEDTTYPRWAEIRADFLAGRFTSQDLELTLQGRPHPYLTGEFGALLTACFGPPIVHHVEYQLRALRLQTRIPDEVIVVSRHPYLQPDAEDTEAEAEMHRRYRPMAIRWVEPMYTARELAIAPEAACIHLTDMSRPTTKSLGCADKNTALVVCQTENILFLDDCCLPGPGLVEQALDICIEGKVALLRHRQLRLDSTGLTITDANDDLELSHAVMGIVGAPLSYLLAINGWNTELDGQRSGLDAELKLRMDAYLKTREKDYALTKARVYEIEHSYPWNAEASASISSPVMAGWYRAPGPSLSDIRERVLPHLEPIDNGNEEIESEEETDGVDD